MENETHETKEMHETKENHFFKQIIDTKIFPYILSESPSPSASNLNNLVKAIGVLCFDGGVDLIYPQEQVDDLTIKNLTFLAFPESNLQGEQQNKVQTSIQNISTSQTEYTYYTFKIRQCKISLDNRS
jgi:hypothetical protein